MTFMPSYLTGIGYNELN